MVQIPRYDLDTISSRLEITDRLHLYAHAIDRREWELLDEVFHADGTWWVSSLGQDNHWRTAATISSDMFAESLLVTTHQVSNILITFDGTTAHAETYCLAYHRVRADAPLGGMFSGIGSEYDLIAGGRYLDRFEQRNGAWKIASRKVHSEWRHFRSAADANLAAVPKEARGRHDSTDLSTPAVEAWWPRGA